MSRVPASSRAAESGPAGLPAPRADGSGDRRSRPDERVQDARARPDELVEDPRAWSDERVQDRSAGPDERVQDRSDEPAGRRDASGPNHSTPPRSRDESGRGGPDHDGHLVMYLEPDQLVTDKGRPLPRASLTRRAEAALWALRVFVLIVSAMVIYTFFAQLGS